MPRLDEALFTVATRRTAPVGFDSNKTAGTRFAGFAAEGSAGGS